MKRTPIFLFSHVVFTDKKKEVHGSAHLLYEYFSSKNYACYFIKHSLFPAFPTMIHSESSEFTINFPKNLLFPVNIIWEFFYNIFFVFKHANKGTIYVGVDPLNACAGVVAKKLKLVKALVFYTPDYTEKRYKNLLINHLYHFIDELSIKFADQVWCASNKILEIRKKQNVPEEKLFYLPNMPQRSVIQSIKPAKEKFSLICISNIDNNLGLSLITESLSEMKKEKTKLKTLYIIPGKLKNTIDNQVKTLGLEKDITVLGVQTYNDVIAYIKSSKIGIALYDGSLGNNAFGDSLKIREYLACGLPVITTNVPENAEEVKQHNSGKVIDFSKLAFKKAVREMFDNKNYENFKKNAEKVGKSMDIDGFLEKPLQKLFYRI